jgi:hypothetical protein
MRVFVANFGRENYEWPRCLETSVVATMQDERVHRFWEAGNKAGYIEACLAHLKTAKGATPTRQTAGRWFNIGTIIVESDGDVWVHRDGDDLWWTVTRAEPARIELGPDLRPAPWGSRDVWFYRKPCEPWRRTDMLGQPLKWEGLHVKSHDFLATEATLQQLGEDYTAFTLALVRGEDLSPWHSRPEWRAKTQVGRQRNPVTFYDDRRRTIVNMVVQAYDTAKGSNGQIVERRVKNKEVRFASRADFEKYVAELLDAQEGLCAISGVPLQFMGGDDPQCCCSLDRIDSDGHYEPGNLQIVCRFINRWKSDGADGEFRRLLELVRAAI